jgi:uncharacterized alpha-E superfamily protein
MLSRVAERIYWFARYLERVENTARLINVHTTLLMDLPEHIEVNWFTPVTIFNAEAAYYSCHDRVDENNVTHFLLAESSYPSSLVNSLSSARENARTTIDVLPEVIWEQVNELHILVKGELSSIGNRRRRQKLLLNIMEKCQCIWGIISNHMSRNHAHDFLQVGKHLERADMTSRILEMTSLLVSEQRSDSLRKYEGLLWTNLLKALSASQMYIQAESAQISVGSVLGFLIQNHAFPRSLNFSIDSVDTYLNHLPEPDAARQKLRELSTHIMGYNEASLPPEELHVMMDMIQIHIDVVSSEIGNIWFYPDYTKV